MVKNESQVSKLSAPAQVVYASAREKCVRRHTLPAYDELPCGCVLWNKATFHQTIRNPGATHLVFFAKFAPRPRSDENDRTVVCRQIVNRREVITKAGNVSRIGMPDFMHQA